MPGTQCTHQQSSQNKGCKGDGGHGQLLGAVPEILGTGVRRPPGGLERLTHPPVSWDLLFHGSLRDLHQSGRAGCHGPFFQVGGRSTQPAREEGLRSGLLTCMEAWTGPRSPSSDALPPSHPPTSCQSHFSAVPGEDSAKCLSLWEAPVDEVYPKADRSAGQHFLVCSSAILKAILHPARGPDVL